MNEITILPKLTILFILFHGFTQKQPVLTLSSLLTEMTDGDQMA